MKISSICVFATLSAFAVIADAAPVAEKPAVNPAVLPQTRPGAELATGVVADFLESTMTCGSTYSASANISNHTAAVFHGTLELSVGNALKVTTFSLNPKETQKVTVQHDKAFNCQAPLGLPVVKAGEAKQFGLHLGQKTLIPKTFTAQRYIQQPLGPVPWVRMMKLSGTCGTSAQGQAMLFLTSGAPQTVQGDANFGGNPQFKPYQVMPNAQTAVMNAGSGPVDCQGASGIPVFHSYLQNPGPNVSATEVLAAQTVTFQPG